MRRMHQLNFIFVRVMRTKKTSHITPTKIYSSSRSPAAALPWAQAPASPRLVGERNKILKRVFKTSSFRYRVSGINTRSSALRTTGSFLLIQPQVLWKQRPPASQAAKTALERSTPGLWKPGHEPWDMRDPLRACLDPFFSPILKREEINPEEKGKTKARAPELQ